MYEFIKVLYLYYIYIHICIHIFTVCFLCVQFLKNTYQLSFFQHAETEKKIETSSVRLGEFNYGDRQPTPAGPRTPPEIAGVPCDQGL